MKTRTAWLIELPGGTVVLYWYKSVHGYGWTSLAWDALQYESRDAAEAVMQEWAVKGGAFAAEHLFVQAGP